MAYEGISYEGTVILMCIVTGSQKCLDDRWLLILNRQCFISRHLTVSRAGQTAVGLWPDDLEELVAFGPLVCSEGTLFPLLLWHSTEWDQQSPSAPSAQAQCDGFTAKKQLLHILETSVGKLVELIDLGQRSLTLVPESTQVCIEMPPNTLSPF